MLRRPRLLVLCLGRRFPADLHRSLQLELRRDYIRIVMLSICRALRREVNRIGVLMAMVSLDAPFVRFLTDAAERDVRLFRNG